MKRIRPWLPWGIAVVLVTLVVAGLDPSGPPMSGWLGTLVLSLLCAAVLWSAWRWLARVDGPAWLPAALATAVALRLAVGIGLARALPVLGYDEQAQRAGYVFYDAFNRDKDAWALAHSDLGLASAFTTPSATDQYGGLLFVSALIYRVFSPEIHRPLLIVLPAATVSALAVLFTWGFTAMTFGGRPARIAAWIAAVFPDAVLLGASQMREPFLIAGLALTLYGYSRARAGDLRTGGPAILTGALLMGFFSPPFALLGLGIVGLAWLWEGRSDSRRTGWALTALLVLAVIALAITLQAWARVGEGTGGGPLGVLNRWLTEVAVYQLRMLESASGWVQDIFDRTPEWMHIPLAIVNGLVQPFLPAAVIYPGAPIWRGIISLRALGWFALLPFLLYAPLAAVRKTGWRSLQTYLVVLVWVTAVFSAYYAGGDQWDNPRYRTVFLVAQAALAGWAWINARRARDPWLRRAGLLVGGVALLFGQWYAGRYYHTPRLNFGWTLGAVAVFCVAVVCGSLVLDARRRKRLTSTPGAV